LRAKASCENVGHGKRGEGPGGPRLPAKLELNLPLVQHAAERKPAMAMQKKKKKKKKAK
jgi:hypothetical protein